MLTAKSKLNVLCRGFTVLEMIAVIALVFIFAGLMVPTLLKAREMGRSGRCIANLKQLITATRLYVEDDASGRFPGFAPTTDEKNLILLLVPYLGEGALTDYNNGRIEIFRCPSNFNTNNMLDRIDANGNQTDYIFNAQVNDQVAQTRIANPEWVSILYDYPSATLSADENIHRGGSNIAFYDGHVAWFSRSHMLEPHAPTSDPTRDYETWGL